MYAKKGFVGVDSFKVLLGSLLVLFVFGVVVLSAVPSPTAYQVGDIVPPSVVVYSNAILYSLNEEVTITATANDNVKVAKISIYLDNTVSPIKTCSATPCTYTNSYSSPGSHIYYATAEDAAGNVGLFPPQAQKVPKRFNVRAETSALGPKVTIPSLPPKTQPGMGKIVKTPSNKPPIAKAGLEFACEAGKVCKFDGTKSTDPDGKIVLYSWSFGDRKIGIGPTATHVYTAAGIYRVTLRVSDDKGASSTATVVVTVTSSTSTEEKVSGCTWRPPSGPTCALVQPNAFYFDGNTCRQLSACSSAGVPFATFDECNKQCWSK